MHIVCGCYNRLILPTTQLRSQCYLDTHLATEDELEHPHDEHPGDAHEEGEDGGQEEAPPLPLLQTLLHRGLIVKLKMF